jgi:hypothetical protein
MRTTALGLLVTMGVSAMAGCVATSDNDDAPLAQPQQNVSPLSAGGDNGHGSGHGQDDVGLGLYFANGVHNLDLDPSNPMPVHIVDGPNRYFQELYLTSRAPTTEADGMAPVINSGDLSKLDWRGLYKDSEDWRLDSDGVHWVHQTFYRGARWMNRKSTFTIVARDSQGHPVADPIEINAGRDDVWKKQDDAFERRFIARVLTTGCQAKFDCTNPEAHPIAQGLVQLRGALHPDGKRVPANTAEFTVHWSEEHDCGVVRHVPVVHDAAGPLTYGLKVNLSLVSPPARGYYLPGEQLKVHVVYTDGAGTPLFAPGTLPTYGDVLFRNPSTNGIRYVSFNGNPQLYWAHKALQASMETTIAGPLDKMTRIGTTPITPYALFATQYQSGDVEHDGYTSVGQTVPITPIVIGCLFGLGGLPGGDIAACSAPVTDVITFDIPTESLPGTYSYQIKARREWEGEPILAAASLRFQVGTTDVTTFPPFNIPGLDSNCAKCHSGQASVPKVGHGFPGVNSVGPECVGCHTAGFYFEPDADIITRLQYMHNITHRLGPPR